MPLQCIKGWIRAAQWLGQTLFTYWACIEVHESVDNNVTLFTNFFLRVDKLWSLLDHLIIFNHISRQHRLLDSVLMASFCVCRRCTETSGSSGFGFELTFRLRRELGETAPPTWPAALLQALARYVFQSGQWSFVEFTMCIYVLRFFWVVHLHCVRGWTCWTF